MGMNQSADTPAESSEFVRLPSGIPGLDAIIEGGFPFPCTVLLAGPAGCGKTTACLHFLMEGARRNEQGLFFTTLSEPTQWMLRFASRYRFMDKSHFGKLIKYVELGPLILEGKPYKEILAFIEEQITDVMPTRIVIDPVTIIADTVPREKYRACMYELIHKLKNWQSVALLTGEVLPNELYPVEISYITDAIIVLSYQESADGARRKHIEVLKVRGTQHSSGKNLMDVSRDGLLLQPGMR